MFNTHADSHLIWFYACCKLLINTQLFVRGRCRMYDQCFCVTHIGEMAGQFQVINEFRSIFFFTDYTEIQDATKTMT